MEAELAFYSALHLGGAAEEILNVYAREVQITDTEAMKPPFDHFKEAVLRLSAPNTPEENMPYLPSVQEFDASRRVELAASKAQPLDQAVRQRQYTGRFISKDEGMR
ncbi:hypothetical protein BH11PSE7_BH11PSE7_25470 [soil metagenome]